MYQIVKDLSMQAWKCWKTCRLRAVPRFHRRIKAAVAGAMHTAPIAAIPLYLAQVPPVLPPMLLLLVLQVGCSYCLPFGQQQICAAAMLPRTA